MRPGDGGGAGYGPATALLKENPDLAVRMLEVVVQRMREHPLTHEND